MDGPEQKEMQAGERGSDYKKRQVGSREDEEQLGAGGMFSSQHQQERVEAGQRSEAELDFKDPSQVFSGSISGDKTSVPKRGTTSLPFCNVPHALLSTDTNRPESHQKLKEEPGVLEDGFSHHPGADHHLQGELLMEMLDDKDKNQSEMEGAFYTHTPSLLNQLLVPDTGVPGVPDHRWMAKSMPRLLEMEDLPGGSEKVGGGIR